MPNNVFQIIAGTHKGRKLHFTDAPNLRPTPNRVRETLFNWIGFEAHHKTYLDLFAGSGSLGFEAFSRGAKAVTLIENNRSVCQSLSKNCTQLNAQNIQIFHQNACQFLASTTEVVFDFVFLDPPFHQNFLPKTLKSLSVSHKIGSESVLYLESEYPIIEAEIAPLFTQKIKILKQKRAGQVHYCLVKIL